MHAFSGISLATLVFNVYIFFSSRFFCVFNVFKFFFERFYICAGDSVKRLTYLEMQRRREKNVAGGEVAVRETAVGDVFHTESNLTAESDALRSAERW